MNKLFLLLRSTLHIRSFHSFPRQPVSQPVSQAYYFCVLATSYFELKTLFPQTFATTCFSTNKTSLTFFLTKESLKKQNFREERKKKTFVES